MSRQIPQLLAADNKGTLYRTPRLRATGMKGEHFFRLTARDLIKLPHGSELFILPGRMPVGFDEKKRTFLTVDGNAVAAFVSPGHTISHNSSYVERSRLKPLPLFSYAAVAFYKGGYYAAAVTVDREQRQDLRAMDMDTVRNNIAQFRKLLPHNRLRRHLERCALVYCCPAAKNFFLSRYEAPLPTSPLCNARCIGCISYQPEKRCHVTQPRITFVPTPEEVADIALLHIARVKDPVVSFGQGCEGEPLLVGSVLERSIRLIRKKTRRGIINLNTNASKPHLIARLADAGLTSIRVSLNSVRQPYYLRYYKPCSYRFRDVVQSIRIAERHNLFVSINYLVMPGFTDTPEEFCAFKEFIAAEGINMVQWRNLNFDPRAYARVVRYKSETGTFLGMREIIAQLRRCFPRLLMGYFNPPRRRMARNKV